MSRIISKSQSLRHLDLNAVEVKSKVGLFSEEREGNFSYQGNFTQMCNTKSTRSTRLKGENLLQFYKRIETLAPCN